MAARTRRFRGAAFVTARLATGSGEIRRGRLAKARQFADAARTVGELADDFDDVRDAYTALCVLAGIASSDAICCARLGVYSRGEDHRAAVGVLRRAEPAVAVYLDRLLAMKVSADYGHVSTSAARARSAGRAMEALLEAAERA